VREALERRGTPYLFLDQGSPPPTDHGFSFGERVRGHLGRWDLSEVSGVFLRPSSGLHKRAASLAHPDESWRFVGRLITFLEFSSARVINRISAQASNLSKLFQLALIRAHGFAVPEFVATTDPDAVRAFAARHGGVVYKSLSSVRSIVHRVGDEQWKRLADVCTCPTLFQEYIPGPDYRVHVVGDKVFTTLVASDEDDYRFDYGTERVAVDTPTELSHRCIALARGLGLLVAGIDLRRAPDGRWVCFEVNPSPAFSYFEPPGSYPIADAIAELLSSSPDRASGP
jgi:glutathione synthase/RimK-type ligase-like ATP-grasp enzyme